MFRKVVGIEAPIGSRLQIGSSLLPLIRLMFLHIVTQKVVFFLNFCERFPMNLEISNEKFQRNG